MGFASENGYIPVSIETIMTDIMNNINTQFGLTYTMETFVGTNFYKYFYSIAQRIQLNEVKTSEIFAKYQDYVRETNAKISRPVVTNPGLIEKFEAEGYMASVKKPIDADAGKIFICLDRALEETDDPDDNWEDTDHYADDKLAAAEIIKLSTVAGCVTQGDQVETLTLSNGQAFDFKYNLPTRTEVLLRLTLTLSENNQLVIGDPDETKLKLLANIQAEYKLGRNFEPQRYFGVDDAPWAAQVLLEWSDDNGSNYYETIFDADYDDLFVVKLENITLIEA